MSAATILLVIMWLFAAVFFVVLVKDVLAHKNELDKSKMGYNVIVSMVANFFDTLGIGSYAIATSAWKFNKAIKDDLIPGTLNVAFGIPICVEATITMTRIEMDSLTLVLMIASAIVGSIIGAKIISRMDIMKIRVVMGVALLLVAVVTLCKINAIGPFGISRSFFADSSYMLSFSVLCSCVCSRLISPSVSSWHKQDNTLMHQSPGHIQRRTPYNF